jgi:hypothetical protein
MHVRALFVDLDRKEVSSEIVIANQGQILNKKALPVSRNTDTLLISAVKAGCYCDNSVAGVEYTVLSVIDSHTRNLVLSRADSDLSVHTFERQPHNRVYVGGSSDRIQRRTVSGDFTLGADFRFTLRNQRPGDYAYDLYPGLGPFSYLRGFEPQINLYKGFGCIIRTDSDRTRILDTLRLNTQYILVDTAMSTNIADRSHIVAIIDTLLFDFNLNYEFYGETITKTYDEERIDSHLRIYRISDFAPIDSIPVADYPPGDYPDGTFDVADVVGPYIVYYFFGREGIWKYAPAMLFIFDTRTNEATWLRVGWR